jgi:hypothetical protein
MKMISKSIMSVAVIAALVSTSALAQQIIYPAKGQSAKQQQKDEAECYTWAKGQTGYDPAQATQYVAPPPPPATKPVAGGMAKGAVVGGLIGAAGGNDVGTAAAKGALIGGIARHAKNKGAEQQQQQAAAQQQQATAQQQQNFQRAYGACFEGRGYTVK